MHLQFSSTHLCSPEMAEKCLSCIHGTNYSVQSLQPPVYAKSEPALTAVKTCVSAAVTGTGEIGGYNHSHIQHGFQDSCLPYQGAQSKSLLLSFQPAFLPVHTLRDLGPCHSQRKPRLGAQFLDSAWLSLAVVSISGINQIDELSVLQCLSTFQNQNYFLTKIVIHCRLSLQSRDTGPRAFLGRVFKKFEVMQTYELSQRHSSQ